MIKSCEHNPTAEDLCEKKRSFWKKFYDEVGVKSILVNAPRTLCALSTAIFGAFLMTAMQAVTDNRAIRNGLHQSDQPLPDILLDYAPDWIPIYTADMFLNSFITFSAIIFLLSSYWRIKHYGPSEGNYRSLRIARKFFWILGAAYLLRAFSVVTTTLPPSDSRCQYQQRKWYLIPFSALEIMSRAGNTCSDKIFSGHSSIATILGLFWLGALLRPNRRHFNPATSTNTNSDGVATAHVKVSLWRRFAAVGICTWVMAVYVTCVLCRNHYTIDIVVAVLVCSGLFTAYQLSVRFIEIFRLVDQQSERASSAVVKKKIGFFDSTSYTQLQNNSDVSINFDSSAAVINAEQQTTNNLFSPISMQEIVSPLHAFRPENESNSSKKPVPSISFSTTPLIDSTAIPINLNKTSLADCDKKNTNLYSYLPHEFLYFLKVIAWMDGFDLEEPSISIH